MTTTKAVDPANQLAEVEAGVITAAIERIGAEEGVDCPYFRPRRGWQPAHSRVSTASARFEAARAGQADSDPATLATHRMIKNAFDPDHILSPARGI